MQTHNYKLDKEEKEILAEYDKGNYKSVTDKKVLGMYQQYAHATLARNRSINIRISDKVLHKLKVSAAQKGLPYQTLISSILHQYQD